MALGFSSFKTAVMAQDSCTAIDYVTCVRTTSPPTIDANDSDWAGVEVFESPLTGALTSEAYTAGNMKIQCAYDDTNIYFFYQFPGKYMFDSSDNHKCAAVATMFQMGEKATLFNMGGCPLSEAVNCDTAPEGCVPYVVDIAAHWELKDTERAVMYGPNDGTGDDPIANKDDEFAVGPWCRDDDLGENPGNEWSGAWDFLEDATDGAEGYYVFELSRPLTTPSPETDVQLKAGTEVNFGIAFWNPDETQNGWSNAGHVVTACSPGWDWIGLRLVDENGDTTPATFPVFSSFSGEQGFPTYAPTAGADGSSTSTPNTGVNPAGSGEGVPSGAASICTTTAFSLIAAAVANFVVFETIVSG